MIYSLLFSLCFAQETPTTDTTEEKIKNNEQANTNKFPVINSGLDTNLALSQASAASKRTMDELYSATMLDIITTSPISVLEGGTITGCSSISMSNARLKKLSRELDHALSYYELEKAGQLFQSAENGLACLRDTLDPDVVAHLFFLEGILHYNNEKIEKSKNAYSNAVRFNPAINWDDMFSPDYKELFEQAKSEFSGLKEVPLEVYPKTGISSLWINGIPYSEGETPTVYVGDNIIQVLGTQVQNAKLHVDEDASKAVLVLPSTVPPSAVSWVSDPQMQSELSTILSGVLDDGQQVYFYHSGEVWETTIGTTEQEAWNNLEIPKLAQFFGANAKKTIGTGLFWTGTAVTAGGAIYSGLKLNETYTLSADANLAESYDVYSSKKTEYFATEGQYQTGVIVTGVGLGLTGLGYWLGR